MAGGEVVAQPIAPERTSSSCPTTPTAMQSAELAKKSDLVPLVAVLGGLIAVAVALTRLHEHVARRGTSPWLAVFVLIAVSAGLFLLRARTGTCRRNDVVLAAITGSIVLLGLPENPAWASIDAFGKSPVLVYLTLLVTTLAIGFSRPADGQADSSAILLMVVLSAFGGPFFVRASDELHAMLALFAVIALALAPKTDVKKTRVPLLAPALLLLGWSIAVLPFSIDKERHLSGCLRMATALVPWILVASRPPSLHAATRLAKAVAAMIVAGVIAGTIVVLEAGYHFDYRLAFAAQLPLFGEHPNIIAPYFAVAPPLILGLWPSAKSGIGRASIVAAALAALAGALATESQAALGGLAVGVLVFAAAPLLRAVRERTGGRGVAAAILGVVVVGGVLAFAARGGLEARWNGGSLEFRRYLWRTAITSIEARPITGYGYLTGDPLMANAASSDLDGRPKNTHPHNLPLAITMGAGIPAGLLFLGMVIGLFVSATRSALRLGSTAERALAAGCVGSAAALMSSNLLDQGLSLHTPLPLHLGLLLAIASLLAVRRRAAEAGPVSTDTPAPGDAIEVTRAGKRLVPGWAILLLAVPTILILAADRLAGQSEVCRRDGDVSGALRFARAANAANPFSLDHGVRMLRALEADKQIVPALDLALQLADEHPLSWVPFDHVSRLQLERREYEAAIAALRRARELDPTGPEASKWLRRAGEIALDTGNHLQAEQYYRESIQFDYEAVHRLPWRYAKKDAREFYLIGPRKQPIWLMELLTQNRHELVELIKTDPIRARRAATTLVKTMMRYHWFDRAKEVALEYRAESNVEWLPLTVIESEIDKILARGEAPPGGEHVVTEADPFEGQQGQASVLLAEGELLLSTGQSDAALAKFDDALHRIYDMAAEKEYVGRIVDGIFDAHRKKGDLARARDALRATLYFHSTPDERAQRYARFAETAAREGATHDALAALDDCLPFLQRLSPTRGDAVIGDVALAVALLQQSADESTRAATEGRVRSLDDTPAGALLGVFTQRELGNTDESRRRMAAARAKFPEWMRSIKER